MKENKIHLKANILFFEKLKNPALTLWDFVILSVRKDPKLGEVDRNTPYNLVYRTPMGNI